MPCSFLTLSLRHSFIGERPTFVNFSRSLYVSILFIRFYSIFLRVVLFSHVLWIRLPFCFHLMDLNIVLRLIM